MYKYTFIDICSGIGGCRMALEALKCKCIGFSEIDKNAIQIYKNNFDTKGESEIGNILTANIKDIPSFDILISGFPCQPFSNMGKKIGFADKRNNVMLKILEIISYKKPKFVFFENVYSILKYKEVLSIIENNFRKNGLKFHILPMISSEHGLPQNRKRVLIIGCASENISHPTKSDLIYNMSYILNGECDKKIGYTLRVGGIGTKYGDRRNWEYYKVNGKIVRINASHAKKLQGFPDQFSFIGISDNKAKQLLGNSVSVPILKKFINHVLFKNHKFKTNEIN